MSIYLIDNVEGGHHSIYQNTLSSVKGTIIKNNIIQFSSIKNPISYLKKRIKFINNSYRNVQENSIMHFLYLDSFYILGKLFIKKKNCKLIGTLHHYPNNLIKRFQFKNIAKKFDLIIVHSEYIKEQCEKDKVFNVKVINYPSFIDKDLKYTNIINDNKKITLSCIGGTRFDKGIDILVDSFKYLDKDTKKRILFNISGKEDYFKYKDIVNEANKYEIDIKINNGYMTETQYWNNIFSSDYIILPYRKIFTGNSGPMTDAIALGKKVIGPREGNLGYLIEKYKLGYTFEIEDSKSLAKIISNIKVSNNVNSLEYKNFQKSIRVEEFINRYEKIYKSIEGC